MYALGQSATVQDQNGGFGGAHPISRAVPPEEGVTPHQAQCFVLVPHVASKLEATNMNIERLVTKS